MGIGSPKIAIQRRVIAPRINCLKAF
ncbi:uncharacterized protein METZ01_LOCUS135350 [marine metagenome]|uniref:Uncharacterized protein n=1 Tax=marine metagenome TaxID=408172 RepID=A0A381YZM4_9ZZZZ